MISTSFSRVNSISRTKLSIFQENFRKTLFFERNSKMFMKLNLKNWETQWKSRKTQKYEISRCFNILDDLKKKPDIWSFFWKRNQTKILAVLHVVTVFVKVLFVTISRDNNILTLRGCSKRLSSLKVLPNVLES